MKDFEKVTITSREEWRAWLLANHTRPESIWLVTFRKGGTRPHVPYGDFRDEALCFGWIDSHVRRLDDERTMHLLSPRRDGSNWSQVNKDRIAVLTEEGRMHAAGIAKVEQARRDGTWDALNAVNALEVPPDLAVALAAHPPAAERFAAFPPSSRRGILEWIHAAKRPETRARRVAETAELAAKNIRANHPRPTP